MSLLSTEARKAFAGPSQERLGPLGGLLGSKIRAGGTTSILLLPGRALLRWGGRTMEEARGEGWDGALSSLEALLQALWKDKGRGRDLRIGLSHHFAPLHLLPSPPMYLAGEEMLGWLREHLAQDFGAEAETWHLAWQDVPPGRPVPVTSLPAERYDALMERLAAAHLVPRHLSPWFVAAWRRHHRALGRNGAWLALVEAGRLALARVEKGRPTRLGMSRLTEDGDETLPAQVVAAVARQALYIGIPAEGDVWLLAPDRDTDWTLPGTGLALRPLAGCGEGWGGLLP